MDKRLIIHTIDSHLADIARIPDKLIDDINYFPPTVPLGAFLKLPAVINQITDQYETLEEKSIALISTLSVASSCLDDLMIPYRKKRYHYNLFQIIAGPPACNKGIAMHARTVTDLIQERFDNQYKTEYYKYKIAFDLQKAKSKKTKDDNTNNQDAVDKHKEILETPIKQNIVLPADISSASIVDLLHKNKGIGIMLDSEAQTVLNTLNQDWGKNLVTIFLKSFENEQLELARKSIKDIVSIKEPRLSILLTGNPEHLNGLVKSITNGLYSRFCIYQTAKTEWVDINKLENNKNYKDGYYPLMRLMDTIHKRQQVNINFTLTNQQLVVFNKFFALLDKTITNLISDQFSSVVKRQGLIFHKYSAILSSIRQGEGLESGSDIICHDDDFVIAIDLCATMLKHSIYTFLQLNPNNLKSYQLYQKLPSRFNRKEIVDTFERYGIKTRQLDNYLKEFTLTKKIIKVSHGVYEKNTPETLQNLQYHFFGDDVNNNPFNDEVPSTNDNDSITEDIAHIAPYPSTLFDDHIISYTETSQNQLDLKWIDFMYRATTYNKAQIFEFMSDVGIINNHEDQLKLAISYEKITETSDDQYELATPDW